ncbi:MAG: phosphoadenylyl-sulfate reductase [Myxococcota bacterium]
MVPGLSPQELGDLEERGALAVLQWASERYAPGLVFATGFGVEGCIIVDLVARHGLNVDIFTLDTGLLFPETYELWRRLEQRYGITIRAVKPAQTVEEQNATHGDALWTRDSNQCCNLRKVLPLNNELKGKTAWISAIRREQTPERANARAVEPDAKFNLVKINPLVAWTKKDVWRHVFDHNVPYNPLHDQGYPSIGCAPCTTPVAEGEDPRAGRWRGQAKRECGLHVQGALPVLPSSEESST